MIDLHAHILPGFDDGARTLDEAVNMAREFSLGGTDTVVATPHFIRGSLETDPDLVIGTVIELNEVLRRKSIGVQVLPGMEIEMCHEIPELVKNGELLTLNNTGRYLLVELPFASIPPFASQVFYELRLLGVTPVLAHPERNAVLGKDLSLVYEMISRGVMMQVNGGSILGVFGSRVKKAALTMLKNNLAHFVGGDAHQDCGTRGPNLHFTAPVLQKMLGPEETERLLVTAPKAVIAGADVPCKVPVMPKTGIESWFKKLFSR